MHNLTQEDLAEAIGITRQTVIAMEKGKYNPSLELAFKIVHYFKVKIEDVFFFEQNDKKANEVIKN